MPLFSYTRFHKLKHLWLPRIRLALSLIAALIILGPAQAQAGGRGMLPPPNVSVTQEEPEVKPAWVILPYAFPSESLGTAGGLAGGTSGYLQDQLKLFGAVMGSTNESSAVILSMTDLQFPGPTDRLFMDIVGSVGFYSEQRAYIPASLFFNPPRAGTNQSIEDDFISDQGEDNFLDIDLRYVLPIGGGEKTAIQRFTLDKGLLVSEPCGAKSWNPLKSGITSLELEPFYRFQSYDRGEAPDREIATNGLTFALVHNNTDFPTNPSRGGSFRVDLTRDFGLGDSNNPWTMVGGEAAGYLDLGDYSWSKQNVLAFHFWTQYATTWKTYTRGDAKLLSDAPPHYKRPSLGGFWRMRGYNSYRFNDKAAILYTAEWRVIPQWQPLPDISWLKFFKIDWWQFVAFGELGRVSDQYDLGDLHSDMKWDAGLGLRLMIMKAVCRLDMAWGEEGLGVYAMVGHPF